MPCYAAQALVRRYFVYWPSVLAAEARHLINQQGRWETLLPRIFAAQLIAASITFSWFLVACAALILILITS